MDFNQFTNKSQHVISTAQQLTLSNGHQMIENGHILKTMLDTDQHVIPHILKKFGANPLMIAQTLDSIILSYPKVTGGDIQLSRTAQKGINEAIIQAKKLKDDYVSLEHLLIGIIKSGDSVAQLLKDNGLNVKDLLKVIEELRKGGRVTSSGQEDTYNSLSKYAKNLNEMAKEGKLDPVIGRDDEIRRVLQILTRRTKNNPILIGDPGVGKTA